MLNRKNRKIAAVMTAMMLFTAAAPFSTLHAEAAGVSTAKEEAVYGNLDHDGSVKEVYVVNIFREEGEKITDYGNYSQVRNLTTDDKIDVKDQCMTIETDKRPLYYEGIMENAELPWNIDISYRLNGSAISAEDLAGKSGELGIYISVKENSRCDKAFFENYGLQITLSLDGNLCRDIQTEGATIANVGSNKQLTYTVLPGKGSDIAITSQVIDFTMDKISINGIKLNLNVDIDTSELTDEAKKIQDATKQLDDGAGKIDSGAQELNAGTAELKDGTAALKENSSKLVSAMDALEANVSYAAYMAILEENGLTIDLREANEEAITRIEKLSKLLKAYPEMEPVMKPMIEQLIQLLEANNAVHDGTEQYLNEVNSKLDELKDAVGEFDEGITAVDDGAAQISGGAGELADGTAQLKDGTGTMKDETSSIDKKISDKVDQMQSEVIGQDMKDVSFVSGKNTDVDAVQFVLKTEPIKEKAEEAKTTAEPEKKGFFQKLLDLFR